MFVYIYISSCISIIYSAKVGPYKPACYSGASERFPCQTQMEQLCIKTLFIALFLKIFTSKAPIQYTMLYQYTNTCVLHIIIHVHSSVRPLQRNPFKYEHILGFIFFLLQSVFCQCSRSCNFCLRRKEKFLGVKQESL